MAAAGCGGGSGRAHATTSGAVPIASASCADAIVERPLPAWARAGFSPQDQSVTHATSVRRQLVAVTFGPLSAPPARGINNKILWIARPAPDGRPLRIVARLHGTTTVARRRVDGGPGPSTVDLPAAGCWTLSLSWSGHRDAIEIPYGSPRRARGAA